ncbi:TonB-dependent receptor [Ideonella sp. 4Y11]|uniref:TonB-dependent receptor n=1 Tax=Ideonella aquatica TaxID=2824119 RepID=A0A941BFM3_9BURK|nr:TonB-dependent receptor [Ideonella aquatica]MBQ0958916.1 TonB-dependent receptor [Ideonella aquatica]
MPAPHRVHPETRCALSVRLALCSAAWLASATPLWAQPVAQQVEVVGTSPLPGQGVDRNALPYSTQVVRRGALDEAQADNATDFLSRRVPGAQVNDIQGSPFQGDLTFRGYRASGILGAAQGVSVYVDGVRFNEPFGDVVNWDMVPEFALHSLSLVPGANPAFGLNTLGGALSLTTATGLTAPGLRGEAALGSFGRKKFELSHGGSHADGWHHYAGIGLFDETGWRDHSDGRLANGLFKLGRQLGNDDFTLSLQAGQSRLVGNGLVPLVTLDEDGARTPDLGSLDRAAVYTHPDLTRNRLLQLSGQWRRQLDEHTTLESLVYLRDSRRTTINGDEADDDDGDGDEGGARQQPLAEEDEPNASFNRTATRQKSAGVAMALSGRLGAHQWQVGAAADHASVSYEQTEQAGVFDDTRGVLPVAGEDTELSARVSGSSTSAGLYASDTWQVAADTHLTGTVRINWAQVGNTLSSVDDDTGEFEAHPHERFRYTSVNPALGVAHRLSPALTVFANLARNNRVPTVIELGCADPEEPCRLPAGLQADPYLKQVIATSAEAGARFTLPGGVKGSITAYRTNNRNDILFRSTSVTGQLGYFANFPRTRHQGLDVEAQWKLGTVEMTAAYSHLEATYQAHGVLRMGERNVTITPGTRIAGLPRHQFKFSADWRVGGGWSVGADLQALSGRSVAGNEDGLLEDGDDERVDLSLPGYALVNLRTSWKPAQFKGLELFGRITNVFNRRYASFGALAATQFDAQGQYVGAETEALFVAPGAPRAFQVGVRWQF